MFRWNTAKRTAYRRRRRWVRWWSRWTRWCSAAASSSSSWRTADRDWSWWWFRGRAGQSAAWTRPTRCAADRQICLQKSGAETAPGWVSEIVRRGASSVRCRLPRRRLHYRYCCCCCCLKLPVWRRLKHVLGHGRWLLLCRRHRLSWWTLHYSGSSRRCRTTHDSSSLQHVPSVNAKTRVRHFDGGGSNIQQGEDVLEASRGYLH